jgi:hypothetical protein
MGEQAMRITVVGFLAIAAAIIAVALLTFYLNDTKQGPESSPA